MNGRKVLCLALLLVCCAVASGQAQALGRKVTKRVSCADLEKAEEGDVVHVSYTGRLKDGGKVFDTTEKEGGKPISFELGKKLVIAGWEQGLLGTCPGESIKLDIPSELGYGESGVGGGLIPGNADLVFDLTLEKLDKKLKIETTKAVSCNRDGKVKKNDRIQINYRATVVSTGAVIGDTFSSGEPLDMTVGKTGVPGWDKGVAGACTGESRRIVIPPSQGYGEDGIPGVVPPNAIILIELEVLKIENRVDSFLQQISSGSFRGRRSA